MKTFLCACIILLSLQLKGQTSAIKFYDVITEDSVVMYLNNGFNYTQQHCASYKRYTRVDDHGNFYDSFIDSSQKHILATGFYKNGEMNGYFELFYPNGNILCKGHYKNGLEDGIWNFFYDNGKPERTLTCTEADIFLTEFSDETGKVTVKDGNGYFSGRVPADASYSVVVNASGKIVNGKADSLWTSTCYNILYTNEKFVNGKFIEGGFPNSMRVERKKYTDQSILNNFFLVNHLAKLEKITPVACPDTTLYKKFTNTAPVSYSFDYNNFYSYAKDKIDRAIVLDGRSNVQYNIGMSNFILAFTMNDKGIPEKFMKLTPWGDQFTDGISNVLTRFTKFPPGAKLYFHLQLYSNDGNTVSYKFFISRDDRSID